MTTYYNDNDRHIVAWLKELIKAGMITDGDVDDRSIKDVKGTDLKGYTRCHFFAGIGGWDYALHLAGWPADRYVWTGSCPCQPLSGAGQRKGEKDERHLWPDFYRLISECRPATVFGEQVASRDGREWFAGVRADLEALDYAVGGSDLCAAGEAAPHERQRIYWVADGYNTGRKSGYGETRGQGGEIRLWSGVGFGDSGKDSGMANSKITERGRAGEKDDAGRRFEETGGPSGFSRLADADMPDEYRRPPIGEQPLYHELPECGGGMGDTVSEGRKRDRPELSQRGNQQFPSQPGSSYWSNSIYIPCGDGKKRRIEPGISPLVDGLPGRVGLLRGYGNAIVPQVAARFIRVFQEVRHAREGL